MTEDVILDSHHVLRHCQPRDLENERPTELSFEMSTEDKECLSVFWLEKANPDYESGLAEITRVLNSTRTIRQSHRLASLNVGVVRSLPVPLLVEFSPVEDNPYHSDICPPHFDSKGVLESIARELAYSVNSVHAAHLDL